MNYLKDENAAMPSDEDLRFFDRNVESAENVLNYGILKKGNSLPIYFVTNTKMDEINREIIQAKIQDEKKLSAKFEEWKEENAARYEHLREEGREEVFREIYESHLREAIGEETVDALGMFIARGKIQSNGPEIWICYEKIQARYSQENECRYATLKILIHELGHAVMDAETSGNHYALNAWVEEALANLISLKYQDAVKSKARENTDCFEFSKEFVRNSVEGYRVGLDMFEAESQGIVFEWTKWRDSKYFMDAKTEDLLEWRHYIENNQQLDPNCLIELYRKILEFAMVAGMNYSSFYKNANRTMINTLVSMWASGHQKEQECLRELLEVKEHLIAEPVFQTIFPWELSNSTFQEHASNLNILDDDFVNALSSIDGDANEFAFSADRYPYKHQSESWKAMLCDHKTIAVTTGTGSGKTECFIIPVLQDLYRQKQAGKGDGIQAIFLYPLNALMKNQRERIHAWCDSLPQKLEYAIYNGDMEETGRTTVAYPQICTREDMRNRVPQILFTNPTMLNYMMVRAKDQGMLDRSKGMLRWIILDEAHTYSGSSATELALQIRRVLDAFGVTVDQVNFAVTSATMGGVNAVKKLTDVVSQLTGKNVNDIVVINGERVIPGMDQQVLDLKLAELNAKYHSHIDAKMILDLRKKLNDSPALSASDITASLNLNIKELEQKLKLIDFLGTAVDALGVNGKPLALLPTRAHFFIRAINGVYACVNPNCSGRSSKSLNLGSLTTYQNMKCPHCGGGMVEVACCADCGEMLVVGERKSIEYRLRTNEVSLDYSPFDVDSEDLEDESPEQDPLLQHEWQKFVFGHHQHEWQKFVFGIPQGKNPRNVPPSYFKFDAIKSEILNFSETEAMQSGNSVYQSLVDQETGNDLCPCCGVTIGNKLRFLRASSNFLGRILASDVLDNATPMDKADLAADRNILRQGRRYITFTDSRQGTAKSAMGINQDVERNWIRSAIYQYLAKLRQDKTVAQKLTPGDQQTYNWLLPKDGHLPPALQNQLDNLRQQMLGNPNPAAELVEWKTIKSSLDQDADLNRLYEHIDNARRNKLGVAGRPDYLDAMYIDQFGWIPKTGNSLENLGLVHVVYPTLSQARVPDVLVRLGFTDEDWQSFLKIGLDYLIRARKHICFPSNISKFSIQQAFSKDIYDFNSTYENGAKWPQLDMNGKLKIRQPKLVLLLMAALGYKTIDDLDEGKRGLVNSILAEAWRQIKDHVLTQTDSANDGYRLDLFDQNKVKLQIVERGWRCPVDSVVVDTLFKGYSPRMRGFATQENIDRFKVVVQNEMEFPYFPYANGERVLDNGLKEKVNKETVYQWISDNWKEQKKAGILGNLHFRILSPSSIYMAGEHSAQQQTDVLTKYENEFNKGHLNILSCSTTMEMGVDLKGISAVVMNSVPPKPANYQQRAGRAGRRNETKSLALTFCTPNPVGINAWKNPIWPLEHKTEMPEVKLTSPQIIQRHINAFLLARYVETLGGMGVKESIGEFFESTTGMSYEGFDLYLNSLLPSSSDYKLLSPRHKKLVLNTCLSGQSLTDSIAICKSQMYEVSCIYKNRKDAIKDSLDAAQNAARAIKKAIENRKDKFLNTSLLVYLAEQNFLPSAGIPTGLVEFNNECRQALRVREPHRQLKLPTQHLSQAISMYAPGKQVVIDEWCYESSGISMKTKFDETKRDIIQECANCGYAQIVYGTPLTACPQCGSARMFGLRRENDRNGEAARFTEIVEPAGFSVDWNGAMNPKRSIVPENTLSFVQPLLLKMQPWAPRVKGVKISLRTPTEGSEILFYNNGSHKSGFMLCPHCGRMESETDKKAFQRFIDHRHLQTGGVCEGAGHDGTRIRRNVLLVGRYQTDFVEVKFFDRNDNEIVDESILYSLGVIISRKLAEFLGVNDGEIEFGYNRNYNSIFIYDTAIGGAGYSPLLRDYKNEVLDLARMSLSKCCCTTACTQCLVDRSSQWYLSYLNRPLALDWLETEYKSRTAPKEITDKFGSVDAITSDWNTEFYRLCKDDSIKELKFFISSSLKDWKPENFLFTNQINLLKAHTIKCSFVVDQKLDFRSIDIFELTPLLRTLYGNDFELKKNLDVGNLKPLLGVVYKDGRHKIYISQDVSNQYDETWGDGMLYSTMLGTPFAFDPIGLSEITSVFNNSDEGMFDLSIKIKNVNVHDFLDAMNAYKSEKWQMLNDVMSKEDSVKISYADMYLNTPLGCIILANMVKSLKDVWNVDVSSLNLDLAQIKSSNIYGNNDFDSDFATVEVRNDFLKKCFAQIVGVEPYVEVSNHSHPRFLRIKGAKYECEIRPDAGVAWGWALDNRDKDNRGLRLRDCDESLDRDFALFNKRTYDGILYTVAWKKI